MAWSYLFLKVYLSFGVENWWGQVNLLSLEIGNTGILWDWSGGASRLGHYHSYWISSLTYTLYILPVIWGVKSRWYYLHFTEEKMKIKGIKVTCPWPLSDLYSDECEYMSGSFFATWWCLLSLVSIFNASPEQCNYKPQLFQPYLLLPSYSFPYREN